MSVSVGPKGLSGSATVYIIDPGCGCCSYVTVGEYASLDEVPDRFRGPNFEIDVDHDDDC
jgi:hypothetical protein